MSSHTYVKDEECGHLGYVSSPGCVVCAQAALVVVSEAAREVLRELTRHGLGDQDGSLSDAARALRAALASPLSPTSAARTIRALTDTAPPEPDGPPDPDYDALCECPWKEDKDRVLHGTGCPAVAHLGTSFHRVEPSPPPEAARCGEPCGKCAGDGWNYNKANTRRVRCEFCRGSGRSGGSR